MRRSVKKRSRKEILTKILNLLQKKGDLTINELATGLNCNWSTVSTNLDLLRDLGRVSEIESNKGRVFSLTNIEPGRGTLFRLPISEKGENYSKFLFSNIKEIWTKETGRPLGKTRAHKIAVNVANNLDLPAPRGWYMYGELMVQQYDDSQDYHIDFQPENKARIMKQIKTVVIESKSKTITQLKEEQYEPNKLYSAANQLSELLTRTTFKTKEDCLEVKEALYNLLFKLKIDSRNKTVLEAVDGFSSTLIRLLKLPCKKINALKPNILSSYNAVWNLVALMNFYNSLLEQKFEIYTKELLDRYLASAFEVYYNNSEEQLLELSEYLPPIKMKDLPINKYKGIAKPQSH